MPRRNVYTVGYHIYGDLEPEKKVDVIAENKWDAYMKATYEKIPKIEGSLPYCAWVKSVTYQNGNCREFNTFPGNPF